MNGFLYERLRRAAPEYTETLHGNENKPFSLSFEFKDGPITLTLNTWAPELTTAIPKAFPVDSTGHLHNADVRVDGIQRIRTLDPSAKPAASNASTVRIAFQSPTCFTTHGVTLLFPEPRLLLESAIRRTSGHDAAETYKGVIVNLHPSDYKLETEKINMGAYTMTGFKGWCEYRIFREMSDDDRSRLFSLLRLLPYTGVGYKTTMGLGVVADIVFPSAHRD
jgi:CRISPR-associated endoribonuclease Cas6